MSKSYPFIISWGNHMGSMGYYIADQINLAIKDNAPPDAIYKNQDGEWETSGNIKERYLRGKIEGFHNAPNQP